MVTPNFTEVPGLHIIADRQKSFYKRFDARFLASKLFSLASWLATFGAVLKGYFPHFHRLEGGVFGVPSDFLLDESGRIVG
ncbi:MAG TPA: hypothetical protein VIK01_16030 [Polyangiaceae bacterium]